MKTLSALVLFLFALCATVSTAFADTANFAGKWETVWDGGNQATNLTISQSGADVSGKYTYQGGKISGVVRGGVLTGSWWQKDGAKGEYRFVLSADGRSFKGQWKNWNSKAWQGTWNGVLK